MGGMTDADRRLDQRPTRWYLLGPPLVIFVAGFVHLYVTYLVTRFLAPDLLGEVAARPAAFAALITLVALPMHVALWLAFTWEVVKGVLAGAEPPAPAARTRWRRVGEYLVNVLPDVAAALIVFEAIADLSAAPWAPLLAITVLGPIVLVWSHRGLGTLSRWGWRHWRNRGHHSRHTAPPADRLIAADGDSERKGAPGELPGQTS
jgi:hypothetical protein